MIDWTLFVQYPQSPRATNLCVLDARWRELCYRITRQRLVVEYVDSVGPEAIYLAYQLSSS